MAHAAVDSRAVACAMVAVSRASLLSASLAFAAVALAADLNSQLILVLQPPHEACPPSSHPPSPSHRRIEILPGILSYVTVPTVNGRLALCMLKDDKWSYRENFFTEDDVQSTKAIAATDHHREAEDVDVRSGNGISSLSDESLKTLRGKLQSVLSYELGTTTTTTDYGLLPREKWIDLSHDIDVNYADADRLVSGADKDNVYYKYEISNSVVDSGEEPINFVPISEKSKRNGNQDDNTWSSFSKSIPAHWIDLSHDIDVNYPTGGAVLNVEDVDVERNIFVNGKNKPKEEFQYDDVDVVYDEQDGIETMDEVKRSKRDTGMTEPEPEERAESMILPSKPLVITVPKIESLRVELTKKEITTTDKGVPELLAGTSSIIRIFGSNITEDTLITFTQQVIPTGAHCEFPATGVFEIEKGSVSEKSARVKIVLPSGTSGSTFYICAKNSHKNASQDDSSFLHQGVEPWLQIETYDKLLPLWATLIIVIVCLFFSALFSGLNLGLMSLDRTELKILCNTGTEKEKEYARVIQPVRDHGNYLLCSILLGNVAVNSTFTILLDDLTSGVFAVIFSTIAIVLLGEITPQAICSRHGLAVGAKTIHITKAVMGITFPLSYPVSKLLDVLLGEEIGNVYNRERLKELVKVTNDINDLDKDEVNIISGALELHKKTVSEVMTKIEDVFMLDYEAVLDFETVSEIMKSGFSRIPVYEATRTNIIAMLYIKDLVFVDPDDNTPLKTLCQFYQNPLNFLFEDVTLDVIFKQFKEGHKGHMAFVQHVNSEGEGDPFYETIGLVTLEDVIEELIQSEIVDETDVFTDNKSKRRRNHPINKLQDFGAFAERRENQKIRITPQLTLATFQYLSTSLDVFKPDAISETILRRMLKQNIIHHIKYRSKERQKSDPSLIIYEIGKPVDYFVLILEGRVEVIVGREKLIFESGPFTYFGIQALLPNMGFDGGVTPSAMGSLQSINMDSMIRHTFVPDYSVRAVSEVFYIRIKRSLYLAAKRATLMLKCAGNRPKESDDAGEQFDDEVEQLLHSLEEESSPVEAARNPSHNVSFHASPAGQNGALRKSLQHLSSTQISAQPVAEQPVADTAPHESSALLPS